MCSLDDNGHTTLCASSTTIYTAALGCLCFRNVHYNLFPTKGVHAQLRDRDACWPGLVPTIGA